MPSLPFKFTEGLDPTQFHCIRYIGPPPKTPIDKTAIYYLFESTSTEEISFVAPLTFTWAECEEEEAALLILPLWMKSYNLTPDSQLKFTKVPSLVDEFAGTLRLEWFGSLADESVPLEEILPEILGSKRPLCNGTVLPFLWRGRRFLLRVDRDELEEFRGGEVFCFDMENGTLNFKTTTTNVSVSSTAVHLRTLLSGTWSDEYKILKYRLNYKNNNKDSWEGEERERQLILVCGVPLPLQLDLLQSLKVKFEVVDVASLIPEEHLNLQLEEEGEDEEDGSIHEDKENCAFKFIGEPDKISPKFMPEILRKLSKRQILNVILISSARSIESSTQLIQLERSARRFNFQVNCCCFPGLRETERIEIVGRECDGSNDNLNLKEYKWTLSSFGLVDLLRLGRNFCSLKDEDDSAASKMDTFKRALEMIKESEAFSSTSHLYSILSGKRGNFNFYGYKNIQEELRNFIKGPLINPEAYDRFGLPKSSGFLLYGPTGCGKTTLCLNILTGEPFRTLFTVFHVPSASQLLSKYFGETEANIRKLFAQARERKPAIIFIDQIETLGRKRGYLESGSVSGNDANDRYLSTLLNEMDGICGSDGVTIIACANRIEILDEALLRPGRLDRHFHLEKPDADSRREIFQGYKYNEKEDEDENEDIVVKDSDGWTGAQIKHFIKSSKQK